MKANEAPEKIYLPIDDSLKTYARKDSDEEIEYTRTDAFIEKACFYIKNMVLDIVYSDVDGKDNYNIDKFIEDFKNYIKGE